MKHPVTCFVFWGVCFYLLWLWHHRSFSLHFTSAVGLLHIRGLTEQTFLNLTIASSPRECFIQVTFFLHFTSAVGLLHIRGLTEQTFLNLTIASSPRERFIQVTHRCHPQSFWDAVSLLSKHCYSILSVFKACLSNLICKSSEDNQCWKSLDNTVVWAWEVITFTLKHPPLVFHTAIVVPDILTLSAQHRGCFWTAQSVVLAWEVITFTLKHPPLVSHTAIVVPDILTWTAPHQGCFQTVPSVASIVDRAPGQTTAKGTQLKCSLTVTRCMKCQNWFWQIIQVLQLFNAVQLEVAL